MSDETTTTPKEYFIRRTYAEGIISCGGPYATRDEAHRAARRYRPANGRSVEVREDRLDPVPRSGRHLVLRLRRKDTHPGHSVVVGPFVSRREARNFLRHAAEMGPGFGPRPLSSLGSLRHDWEPIEAKRTTDVDSNAWLRDKRLAF
jgi:hypothetical protein